MEITIFDLDLKMYNTMVEFLSNGWVDSIVHQGASTVSVRISNDTKFFTMGNGVVLEYMGRSVLLDRVSYFYIKIA